MSQQYRGYDFEMVNGWASNIASKLQTESIFDLDILFIPANVLGSHWFIIVIDFMKKRIESFDSQYHSDNLGNFYLQNTLRYLSDVSGGKINLQQWTLLAHSNLPQQIGDYDCGVFLLMYRDLYFGNIHSINESSSTNYRGNVALHLLRHEHNDQWSKATSWVKNTNYSNYQAPTTSMTSMKWANDADSNSFQGPRRSMTMKSNDTESVTDYEDSCRKEYGGHIKKFYRDYSHIWSKKKRSAILSQSEYNEILNILQSNTYRGTHVRYIRSIYTVSGTVFSDSILYRKGIDGQLKEVVKYDDLYNILYECHSKLWHVCYKTMKKPFDEKYFQIPRDAAVLFYQGCPACHHAKTFVIPKIDKNAPLKMLSTPYPGQRGQVDLIDLTSYERNGMKYILRFCDHHSGYGVSACLPNKEAKTVVTALIGILCQQMRRNIYILQCDKGTEFRGDFIKLIKQMHGSIRLIKGRARHHQTQGLVERSNETLKKAIIKWCYDHPESDWTIAAMVISDKINHRPHYGRDQLTPYQIYYGTKEHKTLLDTVSDNLINAMTHETALSGVMELLDYFENNRHVTQDNDMLDFIKILNKLGKFDDELLTVEDYDRFDSESRRKQIVDAFYSYLFRSKGDDWRKNLRTYSTQKLNTLYEMESDLTMKTPEYTHSVREVVKNRSVHPDSIRVNTRSVLSDSICSTPVDNGSSKIDVNHGSILSDSLCSSPECLHSVKMDVNHDSDIFDARISKLVCWIFSAQNIERFHRIIEITTNIAHGR